MSLASGLAAAALVAATSPAAATTVCTVADPRITEASGLSVSAVHPRVLWMNNDSGTSPDIYGVARSGRTVARIHLRGTDLVDPEALAPGLDTGDSPALFLGDIGDNDAVRSEVVVFLVTEPRSEGVHTVTPTRFRLRYPDGAHDAEALLVDPRTRRLYIATKGLLGGDLYRAPRLVAGRVNQLHRVGSVPPLVTDGAFLPDGRFVLRTYTAVYVYDRAGHRVGFSDIPVQKQGESVAVDDGRLLLGSEGERSTVLSVPVPRAATADRTASPAATASSARDDDGPVARSQVLRWGVGAGVVAIVLGLLTVLASRRR